MPLRPGLKAPPSPYLLPLLVVVGGAAALPLHAHASGNSEPGYQSGNTVADEELDRTLLGGEERAGDHMRPDTAAGTALPEVIYDPDRLPEPARRMRRLIIEACRSGDIERLRPLIGRGQNATQLSLGRLEGDPIDFLLDISGDKEGQEILAILLEVMEAGFVHLDPGTEREHYVWPYFFALPLEELTPEQRVELFTLVTAGDYEDMKDFGAYIFYRAAITPEGRWLFFVAGD